MRYRRWPRGPFIVAFTARRVQISFDDAPPPRVLLIVRQVSTHLGETPCVSRGLNSRRVEPCSCCMALIKGFARQLNVTSTGQLSPFTSINIRRRSANVATDATALLLSSSQANCGVSREFKLKTGDSLSMSTGAKVPLATSAAIVVSNHRTGPNQTFWFDASSRSHLQKEVNPMDSIRSMFVVSVAQLVVLGAIAPAFADGNDSEDDHRRLHSRRSSATISHCRADYPVITNWLTTPDDSKDSAPESI